MDLTQGLLFDDLEPVNTETDQEAECSLGEMLDQDSPEVILDPENEATRERSSETGQELNGQHAGTPGVADQNEAAGVRWTCHLIDLSPHPPISRLARVYPDILPHEFAALVEDIRKRGQEDPIDVWRGLIIDGRHRFYACLVAGVMPVFNNLPTDVNPFSHVRTKNDLRRHSSPNDRAETAYMVWAMEREGFPNMPEGTGNDFAILQNDWDKSRLEDVAAEAGVSPRLVSYVASVQRESSTASPELRAAAERKLVTYSDASSILKESPEVQRRAVELVQSGKARTAKVGAMLAIQEVSENMAAGEAGIEQPRIVGEVARLYCSSLANFGQRLEPGSVQLIVAIPPKEARSSDCSDLVAFSARVLSDEGVLVVPVYPEHLLDGLLFRVHPDLQWIWEFELLFDRPIEIHVEPHVILTRRIPLLAYGKSKSNLADGPDVIEVPSPKLPLTDRRRILEQGMERVIDRFADPGGVVCLTQLQGMGPAAMAAIDSGCVVIGCDEDRVCLDQFAEQLEYYVR